MTAPLSDPDQRRAAAPIAPRAAAPALDDTARDQHRAITATVQAECQQLQALEDAIAYRRARVSPRCLGW
jgi:hypothetical protein